MTIAATNAGRDPETVRLLAVAKTRTAAEIRDAVAAGVPDIGENYLNEAEPKIAALTGTAVTWHFIGAIQSNKTRGIAANFDWVHTVDRARIAARLSTQRAPDTAPLNVLLQVNVDAEPQKAGVSAEGLSELAAHVSSLPRLKLRGLMAIPRDTDDVDQKRLSFRRLAQLFADYRPADAGHWDTLSMGMSADFELAIAEGATLIRIGTAIFGPRPGHG
jgi:pyridoxal phosphate enzyme (YggS family)